MFLETELKPIHGLFAFGRDLRIILGETADDAALTELRARTVVLDVSGTNRKGLAYSSEHKVHCIMEIDRGCVALFGYLVFVGI